MEKEWILTWTESDGRHTLGFFRLKDAIKTCDEKLAANFDARITLIKKIDSKIYPIEIYPE